MASVDSSNFSDLVNVGALVRFGMKGSDEFFKGTVYTINSDDGSFGIDDVSRTEQRGLYRKVEGFYHFLLKDVKAFTVLVPGPKPPTTTNTTTKDDQKTNTGDASSSNTTKDDQKTNPGDESSSNATKDDQKTNPGDASSSTTTKDDQKSNPGDASSSTSPSK